MSRYILLPGATKNLFVLVSTEDLNQTLTVELKEELYDMDIFNNVKIETQLIISCIGFVKVISQKQWMGSLKMVIIYVI